MRISCCRKFIRQTHTEMQIIQYTPQHRASCIEIFKSNTPPYFAEEELQGLEVWLNGQDEKCVAYKNTVTEHFYVIEDDNRKIVGCGGFYIIRESLVANMTWGMVHGAYHKLGFGKRLFEHRIAEIKNMYPGSPIILDTTQHSYQFFEKQGFTTTQIREEHYGPGLDRYDMCL